MATRGQTGLPANFRQNAPEIRGSLVSPRGRCGSFLMMDIHTVLVLSADLADRDLKLLAQLPPETNIAVGNSVEAFERRTGEATVILRWSLAGQLLRDVFAMCPKARWVHLANTSRSN